MLGGNNFLAITFDKWIFFDDSIIVYCTSIVFPRCCHHPHCNAKNYLLPMKSHCCCFSGQHAFLCQECKQRGRGRRWGASEFQNDDADDEAAAATIAYFLLPYPIMLLLLPPKPWPAFQQLPLNFLQGVSKSACESIEEIMQFKVPAISAPHPYPHQLTYSLAHYFLPCIPEVNISTELKDDSSTKRQRFQIRQHISDQRKEMKRKRTPNLLKPQKTQERFEEHRQSYTQGWQEEEEHYKGEQSHPMLILLMFCFSDRGVVKDLATFHEQDSFRLCPQFYFRISTLLLLNSEWWSTVLYSKLSMHLAVSESNIHFLCFGSWKPLSSTKASMGT